MLTDYWVIALLLSQLSSFVLLAGAALLSSHIIKRWSVNGFGEEQLMLERRSYLVGSIVQFVLIFQVAALLMFLNVANHHLTGVIKGAMCADGVLGVNSYGKPLLYIKMGAMLLYIAYLLLNYLDNSEPAYPLTPIKYWLIYPVFLLLGVELVYTVLFFYHIKPDVIATCCSVTFVAQSGKTGYFTLFGSDFTSSWLWVFGLSGGGLIAILLTSKRLAWLNLILGFAFITSGIYSLKQFFVKYIYGLPSHNCLYDIFWIKHYLIGYVFFGGYYLLAGALLGAFLLQIFKARLHQQHASLARKMRWVSIFTVIILILLPLYYWWKWDGTL
ncbi:hypothetical protein [uncultured Microscilla sp.]|uniref:hypothetical protein n=1 Tax=uncultured Microscilla sp. TaxID=432653 RepID=UPI0026058559|nr:hypothetical protein [uncultured Microscilla sp.]